MAAHLHRAFWTPQHRHYVLTSIKPWSCKLAVYILHWTAWDQFAGILRSAFPKPCWNKQVLLCCPRLSTQVRLSICALCHTLAVSMWLTLNGQLWESDPEILRAQWAQAHSRTMWIWTIHAYGKWQALNGWHLFEFTRNVVILGLVTSRWLWNQASPVHTTSSRPSRTLFRWAQHQCHLSRTRGH